MRAAWLALLALLALVGHARAVGDEGRSGVAECSPSSPCVHLVAHSHMDPGWRSTFDSYVSGSGNAIHRSAVLACARDPSRRFTFGDASFLVRWLESEGGDAPPGNCAYVPPPRHEKNDPCGGTWLDLFRALIRERRVDVVGGGWVSHDEALTPAPPRGCAVRRRRLVAFNAHRRRNLAAVGGVADRPVRTRRVHPGVTRAPRVHARRGEQGTEGYAARDGPSTGAGVSVGVRC